MKRIGLYIVITFCCAFLRGQSLSQPPRVIISTDIGGSDPDDYQSMIHFFHYADRFRIEGLISSPPGEGRKQHIEEVIAAYKIDRKKLRQHSHKFPSVKQLLRVTKQGATLAQATTIPGEISEGASWIIRQAKARSDLPLYILVWGSITDVAQAVHADPAIKKTIRVYSIGSWNTVQDPKARDYLFNTHPDLWWIENNTSFRGMYLGGFVEGNYSNTSFVNHYIKSAGAMGKLFWDKKKDIKMGDTPSVLYFLSGDVNNPEGESWGGSFQRSADRTAFWTDKTEPGLIENGKAGARSVNKFRKNFLEDWAKRLAWLN